MASAPGGVWKTSTGDSLPSFPTSTMLGVRLRPPRLVASMDSAQSGAGEGDACLSARVRVRVASADVGAARCSPRAGGLLQVRVWVASADAALGGARAGVPPQVSERVASAGAGCVSRAASSDMRAAGIARCTQTM